MVWLPNDDEQKETESPILDIIGNWFCSNCGAGVNTIPYKCPKCCRGYAFISVGYRFYGQDLEIIRRLTVIR